MVLERGRSTHTHRILGGSGGPGQQQEKGHHPPPTPWGNPDSSSPLPCPTAHSPPLPPPEPYIIMGEPDHLWLKPPPLWATPTRPAAFPFFYIEPVRFKSIVDRYNPKNVGV